MKTWYSIKAQAGDPSTASISIHDEIGAWGVSAKQFINDLRALGPVQTINLSIHSPGGEVFDGIAIYNALKNHPATVNATIEGIAASMASVIAMAADSISIPSNAFLMIHNPSGMVWGDAEDMQDMAALLNKLRDSLLSAYTTKTGMTEASIIEMMDAETWLTGKEAVEMGFADVLTDEVKAAAVFAGIDTKHFRKMPAAITDSPTPETPSAPEQVEPEKTEETAPAVQPEETPSAPEGETTEVKASLWDRVSSFFGKGEPDAALKARVTEHEATITARDAEIVTLKARITELEPKAAQLDQLTAKVAELESQKTTTDKAAAAIVASFGLDPAAEQKLPPVVEAKEPKQLTMSAFNALSVPERNAFFREGGKLVEDPAA